MIDIDDDLFGHLAERDRIKFAVAGDEHGNKHQFEKDADFAYGEGCDFIFVVGDFGYGWKIRDDDVDDFSEFAGRVSPIPVIWLDGNHENFDHLYLKSNVPFTPTEVAPNCWHTPRGTILNLAGRPVVAFGGAISVDRQTMPRVEGVSWWHQEAITYGEVERFREHWDASAFSMADVLLSHEAPDRKSVV